MGMEDYQVNGMGYEKPASEQRLDYLTERGFGHSTCFSTSSSSGSCSVCGCRTSTLVNGTRTPLGWFNVTRIINPSVCRYSEV